MKRVVLFLTLVSGSALIAQLVRADDAVLPGAGFSASRYEVLWTKSPFAVATSETVQDSSPDYSMVGYAANVDGVSYASLIDVHNQEHFLISTDKPARGLTLTSITVGHNGADTTAVVQKGDQSITLRLQQIHAIMPSPNMPINIPQGMNQPGVGAFPPPVNAGSLRPFIRFHRPPIQVPPMPNQQQQPGQTHP